MDTIKKLKELIDQSNNIVFFGGAGVSTESGIPDFRSVDGLYNQTFDYPPEQVLSHDFFYTHTDIYYKFHKTKLLGHNAKPNDAHICLATLEKEGKLKAVITQNIDGLHQSAGSKNVIELHGSMLRNYCTKCKEAYSSDYVKKSEGIPLCKKCGSLIKPDIVLYGESLNQHVTKQAIKYISEADMLIIGGTSLVVYPAASLVEYFRGNKLILINKQATPKDSLADIIIRKPIAEVFKEICIEKAS